MTEDCANCGNPVEQPTGVLGIPEMGDLCGRIHAAHPECRPGVDFDVSWALSANALTDEQKAEAARIAFSLAMNPEWQRQMADSAAFHGGAS